MEEKNPRVSERLNSRTVRYLQIFNLQKLDYGMICVCVCVCLREHLISDQRNERMNFVRGCWGARLFVVDLLLFEVAQSKSFQTSTWIYNTIRKSKNRNKLVEDFQKYHISQN